MAEDSSLWTTGGAGDGAATITRADWTDILKVIAACMDEEGVAPAYVNALVGSVPAANTARIGTGGALVDGKPYWNNSTVDVTIPSATGGGNTRIDRVVLRADWTLQTVRITRIAGTDAASPTAPAITQTSTVTYDIKLYQALVDTAGTVTLTDERTFARPGTDAIVTAAITDLAITTAKINDLAVTAAKLAADAVTTAKILDANVTLAKLAADSVDDTKAGNRVPALTRRQGGSATDWWQNGTTTYTPTTVRMQVGAITLSLSASLVVTFPVAFSAIPIVLLSWYAASGAPNAPYLTDITTTTFTVQNASALNLSLFWQAIGPE